MMVEPRDFRNDEVVKAIEDGERVYSMSRVASRNAIISVFALGLIAAGCGSSQAASSTSVTAAPATTKLRTTRPKFSVAVGKITSVASSSFDVSSAKGSVTVDLGGSTKYYQTVVVSVSSISVGSCLRAVGPANSIGNVQASVVTISKPTSSGCAASFGFGGGFARRSGAGGKAPTGGAANSAGEGALGGAGGTGLPFAGAFGTVVSVSASTIEVQGAQGQVGVALAPTTRIEETQAASQSALVAGQCAQALGPKSASTTFSASTVTVSAPGPTGCPTGGFRGGRPATSPPTTA